MNTVFKAHVPRRPLLICIAVLALLAVIYLVGYFMAGDRVPRNASVGEVRIGGMTTAHAVTTLEEQYAPVAQGPLTVEGAGAEHHLVPTEAGLSVDYPATVQRAGAGRSFSPLHIWRVLTGGGPIDPVSIVDEPTLSTAVEDLAARFERPAKDATVAYEGIEIRRSEAETAREVSRPDLQQMIVEAYPQQPRIGAPITEDEPDITTAEADRAVAEFAEPAVSGPIILDTGRGNVEVTPQMIAAATTFAPADGRLDGVVDAKKLYQQAAPNIAKLGLPRGKNASYRLDGGQMAVVPAEDGLTLTEEAFGQAVVPAVPRRDQRTVSASLSEAKATFTTADAEQQRPKEVIGEFTTYYPHASYRNTNIGLAASRINQNTVPVGQVFSLDRALGSRDSGYVSGWVVNNGRLRQETGGGISQSATTVFNAAWFAGLEDVEHQPHTIYFDRYPAGRESTIYSGHIDVKFRNTTDHAIYLEAVRNPSSSRSRGSITVKVWGTKKWDIESPRPTTSGYYSGRTIEDNSRNCEPQSASSGFTARYYRLFKQNGQVVKREDKVWTYDAADRIVCTRND